MLLKCAYHFHELMHGSSPDIKFSILIRSMHMVSPKGVGEGGNLPHPGSAIELLAYPFFLAAPLNISISLFQCL